MTYNIAVVGATGNVGREILKILAERQFPILKIHAIASKASQGKEVPFRDQTLTATPLEEFDFTGIDLVLSSAGAQVSKQFADKAAAAGAVVIDNSSAFRMDEDVPLIVPEVNWQALENYKKRRIIGSPNCVAIPLAIALKPLHEAAPIKRVIVATYQSTSGAGRHAMDELFEQTKNICANKDCEKKVFPKQIAFNVIPHIDSFVNEGQTGEEEKVANETRKILNHPIPIFATCVRVPTFISHAMAVTVEFKSRLTDEEARNLLNQAPGVKIIDHPKDAAYITPIEAAQKDEVFISRIRKDPTVEHGLALWIVADNLRKGAALNTVQIAESLIRNYSISRN